MARLASVVPWICTNILFSLTHTERGGRGSLMLDEKRQEQEAGSRKQELSC
jgi:hypothetical protein